ncbi:MAG: hypothetical protein U0K95_04355 [Eubacterium sp.]|nr:hypothetical protein [Eubacterium sp.]
MVEQIDKINIIELLMVIKEDVSSIKTDMVNFKEAQRTEKDTIMKEISAVRADYKRDLTDMEARFTTKINGIQSIQNSLCGEVDTLKYAEDKKDAKRYRRIIVFIATALGGMILAKLPDFIAFCIKLKGN